MKIVNAMLTGLRSYKPNAKLCYLAYHDALDVPQNVAPLDGVFLEYAPIRRDHHRPINEPASEKNADEVKPLKDLVASFGCYLGPDYEALYGKAELKGYGEGLR